MLTIAPSVRNAVWIAVCLLFACRTVRAQYEGTIGLTILQATTNLNGAGVRVGQPEAEDSSPPNETTNWEVNPATVGDPESLFTWYSNGLFNTNFPNSLGIESGHADAVGGFFYGPSGTATNVAHVDNFEVNTYIDYYVFENKNFSSTATDAVVNQSYTFGYLDAADQEMVDTNFDNFQVKFNTLFVSAACNFTIYPTVCAPGTSYNCISVGAYEGNSSVGPTIDNGRCKPDIVAPGPETSYATPQVAGAAALLLQAGRRGDGGSDTNSAADMRTIKALLLNGAVKPVQWTNIPPSPLDYTNGAGVLNVFNSYEQLRGGKHGWNFSTNIPMGSAHPPVVLTASEPVLNGWDFNTNNSSSTQDAVNHYFLNATNGVAGSDFMLTATLVWNRHEGKTAINNLALYLYNAANSNLVAGSTSLVDNVQHIFVRQLPQGRYDLQVWKAGGSGIVSTNEPYALAWAITSERFTVKESGTNLILSWPIYPAGYAVASTTSLMPPVAWSTNNIPGPVLTNGQNVVTLPAVDAAEFFRLQSPDF